MTDYIYLLASLEARLEYKKFGCHYCASKYKEKFKEKKRRSKGCYDLTTKKYQIENIIYKSCIGNYNINIEFYLESFRKYDSGMLPFTGNLSDQPNKIIEIFNIIEQRRNEKEKDN